MYTYKVADLKVGFNIYFSEQKTVICFVCTDINIAKLKGKNLNGENVVKFR